MFARFKSRLDALPDNRLAQLETSMDIKQSWHKLKTRRYALKDAQYLVLLGINIFTLSIIKAPILLKLGFVALYGGALAVPATCQFAANFLPIATWLIMFFSCQYIPPEWRPRIYVRVLAALETIFYGGDLSRILASHTNSFLDLVAWIPYGLVHYAGPFAVAPLLFIFGPPKTLAAFAFAYGWSNIFGLAIQILFPTAPPWYRNLYGLAPADYSVHGNAGGLARIDKLLGFNLYSAPFDASPQVFGAFPSMHSGSAVMMMLFLSHVFAPLAPLFATYVLWIWWATMYLTHHYFVDLIGGGILSFTVFYGVKLTILPQTLPNKASRWSYDSLELGELGSTATTKFRKSLDATELRV